MRFSPPEITVAPGTTVRWTNNEFAPHSVTGSWADSGTLRKGATFSFIFEHPGTYIYECFYHANMTGRVMVV